MDYAARWLEFGKGDRRFTVDTRETMSTLALDSEELRAGVKDFLRGPAKLDELLRGETDEAA